MRMTRVVIHTFQLDTIKKNMKILKNTESEV